jgi:hypothetical protein
MDVRLPITTAGICLALLISGCSPGDEKHAASLEEKTAKFEQSLDAITDPKLKDAITELGGSLLLLERAQIKLDDNPPRTEYGEDALAVLKQQTRDRLSAGMVGNRSGHPAQPVQLQCHQPR